MPALGSRKTQEMIMAAITVTEARFDDPAHAQGIIDVLDSYASDPVGGGTPLSPAVQERLLSMLRDHPTTVILLAMHGVHPVGVAICFVGLSTFQARPLLNIHDLRNNVDRVSAAVCSGRQNAKRHGAGAVNSHWKCRTATCGPGVSTSGSDLKTLWLEIQAPRAS